MLPKDYSPVKAMASPTGPFPGTSSQASAGDHSVNMSRECCRSVPPSTRGLNSRAPCPAMSLDDDGDRSAQMSVEAADDEESLPPLEKARRRRSMLPPR